MTSVTLANGNAFRAFAVACDQECPGLFAQQLKGATWSWGSEHTYAHARVIYRATGRVIVLDRTQRGRAAIVAAAERLGLTYT